MSDIEGDKSHSIEEEVNDSDFDSDACEREVTEVSSLDMSISGHTLQADSDAELKSCPLKM